MSLSVRHAFLVFALPLTTLLAEPAPLPPPLAALREKAEAGNSIAQYNLGLAYAQGREIPANPVEAFVWLSLAAESGTAGKAYDTLLQEITPPQLAEAKRQLALRKGGASPMIAAPLDSAAAAPDRTAELTAKNQQLAAELAATQAKLETANETAGRALVAAKSDTNAAVDAFNAKLAAAKAEALAAENARAQLAAEKSALAASVDELTADRAVLKQKLAEAGRAPAAKTDDSAPQIAALQAQVAALTAEKASAEQKLAALAAAPAPADRDELAAASVKLETALRSFTIVQNENTALKSDVDAAKAESAALRQQLAEAQSKPAAAAPAADSALKRELADTEAKLNVALRSYVVIAAENDKLKAEAAARADAATSTVAATEARATTAATAQAAQLAEARDQLRQVQAQSAAYAEENFQLRTRLATGGGPAPAHGSDMLVALPVPAKALVTPTPAPVAEPAARTHLIVAGDTLRALAKKYYNDAARWNDILVANRDVLGPNQTLIIGRKLRIP